MAHDRIPENVPLLHLSGGGLGAALLRGATLVGAVAFVVTLFRDSSLAWKSYVVSWSYFTSIAAGGVAVAVVTWIVKAKWNWPVRRIHQSFSAFLPFSFLLFLPMLAFLREDYFPWIGMMADDAIVQKKQAWLNVPFLVSRNVVGVIALFGLALGFVYLALRPDMGRLRAASAVGEDDESSPRKTSWWVERLSAGWLGDAEEAERSYRRMTKMGPVVILVYAVVMTMLAFDWAMSLEPHWFSTLFGGWYFMGAFWGGLAATACIATWLKDRDEAVGRHIGTPVLWDLGKLTFAFTVFWTYLLWSQYIVIWYGKLPWEQAWINTRTGVPWGGLSALVVVLCFVVPFAGLLGARPKKNPRVLRAFASIVLAGLWLWHYMLVFPSLHHAGDPVFAIETPLIGLMFLGLFLTSVRWFLSTFPVVQAWQPPVDPEPLEAEGTS